MLCKELLTVTAEKATKHSAANRKKNIPPSAGCSESSSSWIYLQESTVCYPKQIYGMWLSISAFTVCTYVSVSWWCRIQTLSCSTISSEAGPSSEPCILFSLLLPIKEIFARIFWNWLQAIYISVAYNPCKPINTLVIMTNAVNCHRTKSKADQLLLSTLNSVGISTKLMSRPSNMMGSIPSGTKGF